MSFWQYCCNNNNYTNLSQGCDPTYSPRYYHLDGSLNPVKCEIQEWQSIGNYFAISTSGTLWSINGKVGAGNFNLNLPIYNNYCQIDRNTDWLKVIIAPTGDNNIELLMKSDGSIWTMNNTFGVDLYNGAIAINNQNTFPIIENRYGACLSSNRSPIIVRIGTIPPSGITGSYYNRNGEYKIYNEIIYESLEEVEYIPRIGDDIIFNGLGFKILDIPDSNILIVNDGTTDGTPRPSGTKFIDSHTYDLYCVPNKIHLQMDCLADSGFYSYPENYRYNPDTEAVRARLNTSIKSFSLVDLPNPKEEPWENIPGNTYTWFDTYDTFFKKNGRPPTFLDILEFSREPNIYLKYYKPSLFNVNNTSKDSDGFYHYNHNFIRENNTKYYHDEEGVDAEFDVAWSGSIDWIRVILPGTGYISAPVVALQPAGGEIINFEEIPIPIAVLNPESSGVLEIYMENNPVLWKKPPNIIISPEPLETVEINGETFIVEPGPGSGAYAVCEIRGKVSSIKIAESGTGYTHAGTASSKLQLLLQAADDDLLVHGIPMFVTPTPSVTSSIPPFTTPSITPTRTQTPTITPTCTPTKSLTPSSTATPSFTPTITVTKTKTPTPTTTQSFTPTATASLTASPTLTPTTTNTASPTPSKSPAPNVTRYLPNNYNTATPTPTTTPEPSSSPASIANTPTPTSTFTPTCTLTQSTTPTHTKTPTLSPTPATPTPTNTQTPTNSRTSTNTPTITVTKTQTPTSSITATPTLSQTPTSTITPSATSIIDKSRFKQWKIADINLNASDIDYIEFDKPLYALDFAYSNPGFSGATTYSGIPIPINHITNISGIRQKYLLDNYTMVVPERSGCVKFKESFLSTLSGVKNSPDFIEMQIHGPGTDTLSSDPLTNEEFSDKTIFTLDNICKSINYHQLYRSIENIYGSNFNIIVSQSFPENIYGITKFNNALPPPEENILSQIAGSEIYFRHAPLNIRDVITFGISWEIDPPPEDGETYYYYFRIGDFPSAGGGFMDFDCNAILGEYLTAWGVYDDYINAGRVKVYAEGQGYIERDGIVDEDSVVTLPRTLVGNNPLSFTVTKSISISSSGVSASKQVTYSSSRSLAGNCITGTKSVTTDNYTREGFTSNYSTDNDLSSYFSTVPYPIHGAKYISRLDNYEEGIYNPSLPFYDLTVKGDNESSTRYYRGSIINQTLVDAPWIEVSTVNTTGMFDDGESGAGNFKTEGASFINNDITLVGQTIKRGNITTKSYFENRPGPGGITESTTTTIDGNSSPPFPTAAEIEVSGYLNSIYYSKIDSDTMFKEDFTNYSYIFPMSKKEIAKIYFPGNGYGDGAIAELVPTDGPFGFIIVNSGNIISNNKYSIEPTGVILSQGFDYPIRVGCSENNIFVSGDIIFDNEESKIAADNGNIINYLGVDTNNHVYIIDQLTTYPLGKSYSITSDFVLTNSSPSSDYINYDTNTNYDRIINRYISPPDLPIKNTSHSLIIPVQSLSLLFADDNADPNNTIISGIDYNTSITYVNYTTSLGYTSDPNINDYIFGNSYVWPPPTGGIRSVIEEPLYTTYNEIALDLGIVSSAIEDSVPDKVFPGRIIKIDNKDKLFINNQGYMQDQIYLLEETKYNLAEITYTSPTGSFTAIINKSINIFPIDNINYALYYGNASINNIYTIKNIPTINLEDIQCVKQKIIPQIIYQDTTCCLQGEIIASGDLTLEITGHNPFPVLVTSGMNYTISIPTGADGAVGSRTASPCGNSLYLNSIGMINGHSYESYSMTSISGSDIDYSFELNTSAYTAPEEISFDSFKFNHYLNTDILMASGLSIKNSNFDSIIITNFGELNVLRGHLIGEPAYVYYITKLCNNHMTSFSSSFDNIIGNILIDNLGNAYKIG